VVGRLAPSPTGHLHLGHARSFLLAWWHARSRGGRILLRFEDLDVDRASPDQVETALRDLEWLGLDWDGEPFLQSAGMDRLMSFAHRLLDEGLAYPCTCSRGDIRTAQSAPHGTTGEVRYPGTCRGRFRSLAEARAATGRDPGLRFVVAPGERIVPDRFAGPFVCNPEKEVGDFLITRRDGSPAYQLAVVVDDLVAGVTEVVRGDDLLPSAARQMLLLEALGEAPPDYFHVPLVCDGTGRRLAKREADLGLAELRASGVDPRAVVAWVARHSGFETVERPRAEELTRDFAMERVPRTPVRVDAGELSALRRAR
jgi:glutamyl-tRNA synthetase